MTLLISFLAGIALSFAFAPYHWWGLGMLALILLNYLWLRPQCKRPGLLGLIFGLGYFASGIHWVYISLYYYGDAPLVFAVLANLLLILFLACFPMVVGWLIGRLSAPATFYRALLIPLLWMALETARAYTLSGFPWLSIGYSQLHALMDGLAPIAGVMTIGLVLMFLCTLIAFALVKRRWSPIVLSGILLAFVISTKLLSYTIPVGTPLSVALVQGNVEQLSKFDADKMSSHLQDYIGLTSQRKESVIIWPETAIAFFEHNIKETVLDELDTLLKLKNQALLTGIPVKGDHDDYYNAVIALGNANGRYYKNHLLPFGEYIPFEGVFRHFNQFVNIPLSNFSRGGQDQTSIMTHHVPAGVSICFEAAFGREIRHALPSAQYLINVSNDSWFRESIAAEQHLQMNQMRALEMGRQMARSTNNGITVLIDSKGHIIKRLPRFEQGVLSGHIQPYFGVTPYAQFGNAIFAILMLAYAIIAGLIYPWRNRYARTISTWSDRDDHSNTVG